MTQPKKTKFPVELKVAAFYLLIGGLIGIVWPILGLGPNHPEFEVQSTAYKAGAYFRGSVQELASIVFGVGILMRKSWARKGALILLVVATVYTGNEFAWGFANGPPSSKVRLISYLIVTLWNSIWFFLIFKKSSQEAVAINK